MEVEKTIHDLLPYLLKRFDEKKEGVTIEIGVGTSNFYCVIFAKNGYRTFAIEPLPVNQLFQLAIIYKFELIQACIYLQNKKMNIYSGHFNGEDTLDVSSINSNWWGIKESSKIFTVPALTFKSFIDNYRIDQITYLKIDTEGSEWEIIQQIKEDNAYNLPRIIEFEYGGGDLRCSAKAGWSEEYFSKTKKCIQHLNNLGYNYILMFENKENKLLNFDLCNVNNIELLFKDHFEYGNILMFRRPLYSLHILRLFIIKGRIKAILKPYYLMIKNLSKKYFKLFFFRKELYK